MGNTRKEMGIAYTFILALLIFMSSALCAEARTVKVGYFPAGDYYKMQNGHMHSYDQEYLKKISEYTDFTFEFVECGSWEEATRMLKRHEIELLGTVQWNPKREEEYEFCLEGYGHTAGELVTLRYKGIRFRDYKALNHATIAVAQDYVRLPELQALFKEKGIEPILKFYPTKEAKEQAFLRGETILMAVNSHAALPEWNVIEKFSYTPYFFVSWKGNTELTDALDTAVAKINLEEPTFDDNLVKKYFPDLLVLPLTKAENSFIAASAPVEVHISQYAAPFFWEDEKNKEQKGLYLDAFAQITRATSLKFKAQSFKGGVPQDKTRILTLYYDSKVDVSGQEGITKAFYKVPFNFYFRQGGTYNAAKNAPKVAFVNREQLREFLEEKYPQFTFITKPSPLACLEALENDEVDLVFLNTYTASSTLTANNFLDIKETPLQPVELGFAFRFVGPHRTMLTNIVNKGIKKLDEQELNNKLVQYALETRPGLTLNYLASRHFAVVSLVLAAFILLLTVLASLYLYTNYIKQQKEKVEQFDRERDDFFARMSHDLRTPMNGILGMLELSLAEDKLTSIKENLRKAQETGMYMLGLINDTLDLQRMESGRLSIEPKVIQTAELVANLLRMSKEQAERKGVNFVFNKTNTSGEIYVKADKVRVTELFANLLNNAIKFTPTGGEVEFRIERIALKENSVQDKFIVRDTGIGMSADFAQKKLFEPFMQENSDLLDTEPGSGLGLAIVQRLVELMQGKIEVESTVGKGTTFTVYLEFPLVAKEEAKAHELAQKETLTGNNGRLQGKHILLCEDQPLNAEIVTRLLGKRGCTVTWVANGKLGVDAFSKDMNKYDLILMDIRMPVLDGMQATQAIRALNSAKAKDVPIIALSANAYDEDVEQSLVVGMNDHLAKPISPHVLYETLSKWLK